MKKAPQKEIDLAGDPGISRLVSAVVDQMLEPPCPRFPRTSLFGGKLATWLYESLAWGGVPLRTRVGRLFARPLEVLTVRAWKVQWAATPLHARLMVGVGVGVSALVLAVADRKGRRARAS